MSAKIYNRIQNNFTQISNSILLDNQLSSKSYKLYAYMVYRLGTAPDWSFNENEILRHFKEGRDALRAAFVELIKAGYLIKKQTRNAVGSFASNDYEIFSEPQILPLPENPSTVKPSAAKPSTENPLYNNKDIINKELNNKDLSLSKDEEREFFNNLWKEKKYKSELETFLLAPSRKKWQKDGLSLEDQAAYWEDGFKKKNLEKYNKPMISAKHNPPIKTEDPAIRKVRDAVRSVVGNGWQYFEYGVDSQHFIEGHTIYVTDKRALQYQEPLEKTGIKIELK